MRNPVRLLLALLALCSAASALAQIPTILNVGPVLIAGTTNVQMLVAGQNFGSNGTVLVNGIAEKTAAVNAYGVYALLPVVPTTMSVQFRTNAGQLSKSVEIKPLPAPSKGIGLPLLPPTTPSKPPAPGTPTTPTTPGTPTSPTVPTPPAPPTAPGTPTAPTVPTPPAPPAAPGTPTSPTVTTPPAPPTAPGTPTAPTVPTPPAPPAAPGTPTSPTVPTPPAPPTAPGTPTSPTIPGTPTAPSAPTAPTNPTSPVVSTPSSSCPFAGTCWYVRADGGTPSQCDGKSDAAYPGGNLTGQHCALGDYRYLYDQHVYGQMKWLIAGGDTVIIDNTKQWRVGFGQGQSANDSWCWGDNGNNACTNPTVPAGTASQPTRILGRNYASCTANSAKSQIFGGYGVWDALNLGGAQYVDVQCLEITTHGSCIVHGSPNPNPCSTGYPVSDYDSDGIGTDTNTHDVLLQDLWIHGHTDRGIKGPIGGLITANRVNIDTNGMAGWDLDPGDGTGSPNGSLKLSYVTIQFSGCDQEYPFVDAVPVQACYSQSTGGYGDGIGTPVTNMVSVSIDHSVFRFNTQDGEDFGHVILANQLSITDSLSYANNGGQFKWAGFQNVLFENNIAVANCLRMSAPLPGAPAGYNANLTDFCRANDALSFDFNNNATALLANNTIISYAPVTFDIQCYDSASCAGTTLTMENNIVRGYENPTTWNMGGQQGGIGLYCLNGCNGSTLPLGSIVRQNNIYYGVRGSCPAQGSEQCSDPMFADEPAAFVAESTLDGYNFSLASGSPAEYHGLPVTGLSTDYLGTSFSTPSIGALAYGSSLVMPQP